MAFTTRRGRPPRTPSPAIDAGTPELRFKHAHGLTAEPIDHCLEKGHITPAQHWCGLHLRWLYTVRYGAPNLTTRYDIAPFDGPRPVDDPSWREQREAEYHAARTLLRNRQHYEPVMRLCIHNEMPVFLVPNLRARALHNAALAERLHASRQQLIDGLDLLAAHWKRPSTSPRRNVTEA